MADEYRKFKFPEKRKTLRQEIVETLEALGAPPPHIQMAYYSVGLNPSGKKDYFFELLKQCHDRSVGGLPRHEDWERLYDYYFSNPELHGGFVDPDTQYKATSDMMPYLFPKLKAVQVTGEMEHLVKVVPLTDEDIERIERRLKDDF